MTTNLRIRPTSVAFVLGLVALPLSCGGDEDDSVGGKGGTAGNGGAGAAAGNGGAGDEVGGVGGGTSGKGGTGSGGLDAGSSGTAGGSGAPEGGSPTGGTGGATPCDADPCENGGICAASGETFTCDCSGTGYTGTTCQTTCPGQASISSGDGGDGGAAGEGTGGSGGTGKGGTGGSGGSGGSGGTGGTGKGGSGGSGGSGGMGTSSVACDSTFVIDPGGFVRAPTSGCPCWHGFAYAGGDPGSTVMPTSFAFCGMGCVLNASGTVGPAVSPDYAGVVYLGFGLNEVRGNSTKGTITPTGSGIAVSYTNATSNAFLRVQISSGVTRWCAELTTSGATIPYSMFNTECWEGGMGTGYARQPIDTVQFMIPGGATAVPFDLTILSVKEM